MAIARSAKETKFMYIPGGGVPDVYYPEGGAGDIWYIPERSSVVVMKLNRKIAKPPQTACMLLCRVWSAVYPGWILAGSPISITYHVSGFFMQEDFDLPSLTWADLQSLSSVPGYSLIGKFTASGNTTELIGQEDLHSGRYHAGTRGWMGGPSYNLPTGDVYGLRLNFTYNIGGASKARDPRCYIETYDAYLVRT